MSSGEEVNCSMSPVIARKSHGDNHLVYTYKRDDGRCGQVRADDVRCVGMGVCCARGDRGNVGAVM